MTAPSDDKTLLPKVGSTPQGTNESAGLPSYMTEKNIGSNSTESVGNAEPTVQDTALENSVSSPELNEEVHCATAESCNQTDQAVFNGSLCRETEFQGEEPASQEPFGSNTEATGIALPQAVITVDSNGSASLSEDLSVQEHKVPEEVCSASVATDSTEQVESFATDPKSLASAQHAAAQKKVRPARTKTASQPFGANHPILHVEQTIPPSFSSRVFNILAVLPIVTLTLIILLQTLFTLDARSLWIGNEVRYAGALSDFLQQNSLFQVFLNGNPFGEASPAYFLLLKGVYLFIPTDGPMLLFIASALGILLYVWAGLFLGRFAGRVDGRTNLAAGLILLSTLFILGIAHSVSIVLCGTCLFLIGATLLFRGIVSPDSAFFSMILGFILCGASALFIGISGLLIPIATLILFAAWRGNAEQARCIMMLLFAAIWGFSIALVGPAALTILELMPVGEETVPFMWNMALLVPPALFFLVIAGISSRFRLASLLSVVLLVTCFVLGGATPYLDLPFTYAIPIGLAALLIFCQITPQRLFRLDFFIGLFLGVLVFSSWYAGLYWETQNTVAVTNALVEPLTRIKDIAVSGIWRVLILLPLLLFPWTILVLFLPWNKLFGKTTFSGIAESRRPNKEGISFLWCLALVSLGVGALAGNGSVDAFLPAACPLAILAARSLLAFTQKRATWFRRTMAGIFFIAGLGMITFSLMLFNVIPMPEIFVIKWQIPMHGSFFVVSAVCLVAGAMLWFGLGSSRPEGVVLISALAFTILAYPLAGAVAPRLSMVLSPEYQARLLRSYAIDHGYNVAAYGIHSDYYVYDSGLRIPQLNSINDAIAFSEQEKSIIVMPVNELVHWSDASESLHVFARQWLGTKEVAFYTHQAIEGVTPSSPVHRPAPDIFSPAFNLLGINNPFAKDDASASPSTVQQVLPAPDSIESAPAHPSSTTDPEAVMPSVALPPVAEPPAPPSPETPGTTENMEETVQPPFTKPNEVEQSPGSSADTLVLPTPEMELPPEQQELGPALPGEVPTPQPEPVITDDASVGEAAGLVR